MLLTFLGLTLATTTSTELQIATNYRWSQQARYNAEAGIEAARSCSGRGLGAYPARRAGGCLPPGTGSAAAAAGRRRPGRQAKHTRADEWERHAATSRAGSATSAATASATASSSTTAARPAVNTGPRSSARTSTAPSPSGSAGRPRLSNGFFADYEGDDDTLVLVSEGVAPFNGGQPSGSAFGQANQAVQVVEAVLSRGERPGDALRHARRPGRRGPGRRQLQRLRPSHGRGPGPGRALRVGRPRRARQHGRAVSAPRYHAASRACVARQARERDQEEKASERGTVDRRRPAAAVLSALVFVITGDRGAFTAVPGGIDPLEVLNLLVRANALVVLDSSGSMRESPVADDPTTSSDTAREGEFTGDDPRSKLAQAKSVLRSGSRRTKPRSASSSAGTSRTHPTARMPPHLRVHGRVRYSDAACNTAASIDPDQRGLRQRRDCSSLGLYRTATAIRIWTIPNTRPPCIRSSRGGSINGQRLRDPPEWRQRRAGAAPDAGDQTPAAGIRSSRCRTR